MKDIISTNETNAKEYQSDISSIFQIIVGYLFAIAAGAMLTAEAIQIKKISFIMENFVIMIFWTSALSVLMGALGLVIIDRSYLPRNWTDYGYMLGQSVTYASNMADILLRRSIPKR